MMKIVREYLEHTVVFGDTLTGLSVQYFGTPNKFMEIADLNGIKDPSVIIIGQVLKIPKLIPIPVFVTIPAAPTQEKLEEIMNLFAPGFCDERMARELYNTTTRN